MSHFGTNVVMSEPHFANADPSFLASLVRSRGPPPPGAERRGAFIASA